jgi:hypothetical protein
VLKPVLVIIAVALLALGATWWWWSAPSGEIEIIWRGKPVFIKRPD